jgi:cation transport ATPase
LIVLICTCSDAPASADRVPAKVTAIVLDKTGTLTEGAPRAGAHFFPVPKPKPHFPAAGLPPSRGCEAERFVWWLVAAAERGSEHPLGQALLARASVELGTEAGAAAAPAAAAQDHEAIPGRGMTCTVAGLRVTIGNAALMYEEGAAWPVEVGGARAGQDAEALMREWEGEGRTAVLVAVDGGIVGCIAVADALRPEAEGVVAHLQAQLGLEVWMVTGDNPLAAEAVARALHIGNVQAGVLPGDKAARVRWLQVPPCLLRSLG